MSRPAIRVVAVSQADPADQWISRAAVATVTSLAGLAGAISYSHMRQLALVHGQAGWHAHAFPLSVDGLEVVASLVLLAEHRSGRRVGWLPWAALVIGMAGSLAANVATAGPGTVSRVIAGWPAVALLIAVKLLSGLLIRTTASAAEPSGARHDETMSPPASSASGSYPSTNSGMSSSEAANSGAPARAGRHDGAAREEAAWPARPRLGSVPILPRDVGELLSAARAARDGLHRDGQRLTRDALATRMRADGHKVRNSDITAVLRALRSDTTTLPNPAE